MPPFRRFREESKGRSLGWIARERARSQRLAAPESTNRKSVPSELPTEV